MLPLGDDRREHERHGDRDAEAGEQLLHGVHAQPPAVEVEQRVGPHQRPRAWRAGSALRSAHPRAVAGLARRAVGALRARPARRTGALARSDRPRQPAVAQRAVAVGDARRLAGRG